MLKAMIVMMVMMVMLVLCMAFSRSRRHCGKGTWHGNDENILSTGLRIQTKEGPQQFTAKASSEGCVMGEQHLVLAKFILTEMYPLIA